MLLTLHCRCRRGGDWSGSGSSPRRVRVRRGSRRRISQTFGTAKSPVHIGSSEDPAFDGFQVRDGSPVQRDVCLLTIIAVDTRFALSRKVETKPFAGGQLGAVAEVVGNDHHAKKRIFRG